MPRQNRDPQSTGRPDHVLALAVRAMRLRPPADLPPEISAGPFTFYGVITDNATTVSDLTLTATIADPTIRNVFGGTSDKPKIGLLVSAIHFGLETNVETGPLQADILESVYLHHRRAGQDRYVPLAPAAYSYPDTPNGTTTADALTRYAISRGRPLRLANPWVVDFESDTFEIGMRAAVNTAANVPYLLTVHGLAWSKQIGMLRRVPLDRATADAIGRLQPHADPTAGAAS